MRGVWSNSPQHRLILVDRPFDSRRSVFSTEPSATASVSAHIFEYCVKTCAIGKKNVDGKQTFNKRSRRRVRTSFYREQFLNEGLRA
ncbi:unnamed protein product [Pylaiella littoralis]